MRPNNSQGYGIQPPNLADIPPASLVRSACQACRVLCDSLLSDASKDVHIAGKTSEHSSSTTHLTNFGKSV